MATSPAELERSLANLEEVLVGEANSEGTPAARLALLTRAAELMSGRLHLAEDQLSRIGGRLEEMLAVVTCMTALEYDQKVEINEDDDWIVNALAIGLNIMGDELARATAELTDARDRALAASRAKSAFLANMSHELRTPLNAIIGYSELIRDELDDGHLGSASEDLGKVEVAALHLLNLIQDTLDLSKIEAGKMELVIETFDVGELLRSVSGTVEPMIRARGNAFDIEIDADVETLAADRMKIQQVLYNLLSNAAKFTSHGSVRLGARIDDDGARPWLVIDVRDTGIGIPREKVPLIFGAFTQADDSTSRSYGGTGLGLTISRHFVEMMSGELLVASEPGVGSTFTIRLPLDIDARVSRPRELPSVTSNIVVVADRDPRAHDLLRRRLARDGFSVISAANQHEVMGLVSAIQPTLVILDLEIPGIDGWAVLAALKRAHTPTPVLVSADGAERARALALGASDLLRRPLDPARVAEIAARHRQPTRLGRIALLGDPPTPEMDLGALLRAAGWDVLDGSAEAAPPEAVVLDLRASAAALAALTDLPWPATLPALAVVSADTEPFELARPHAVVDIDTCPHDDFRERLSLLVHRHGT